MNEYLTTKDLTEKLKVTRETIHQWRKQGLPFFKVGGSIRFDPEKVNEWITQKK
jgi:excisionase family DNA binding protein